MKFLQIRWVFISLVVLVELMSCLTIKSCQPQVTIIGCLMMFSVAYIISKPTKKGK
jgi:hypothetical protein